MYTFSLYDDVMTWGQFPQFSPSETGGMLSQNEILLMLACINGWTNSQVTIDYKWNDAHVVLLGANTKFVLKWPVAWLTNSRDILSAILWGK